jgi:hypothetical protein
MFDRSPKQLKSDCPVCYLNHDKEIHEATLRIHEWFYYEVTRYFIDESLYVAEPQSD